MRCLALIFVLTLMLCAPVAFAQEHGDLGRTVLLPTGYPTDMVLIPAGSFPRGAAGEEFDEQPVRSIFLFPILVGKGKIFDRQIFVHIDAGETVARSYACFLMPVTPGFAGVDDLGYDGTSLARRTSGAPDLVMEVGPLFEQVGP